ncbi:MAG: response regulator [Bacteroidetes bacterium]|nr:response regulator [Bacteroidota bacterium]
MSELNTSVLVIDDEEMVRDNIEDILIPRNYSEEQEEMDSAFDVLFGNTKPLLATRTPSIPAFTVDKASNGMEGLRKVRAAVEKGTPYAVIFLDMRMPGWNGLETAIEIRKIDAKAEIIFITAYSDRSIDEIVEQAGQNVGYHCKPYAPEEIIQIATKAVTDYNKLRNLEQLIESIANIGLNRGQLNSLLKNILEQLAGSLDTDMALIGKLDKDMHYEKILSIGAIEECINLDELTARVKSANLEKNEVVQLDELVLARMDDYYVFAVLQKVERLRTEKMYLLRLFVQSAAQAIRNAELNEKLIQKEKLSAVGQVIGMVMHDLRTPIKNIKFMTDMMREEGEKNELIDMIDQSAEQASDIFEDFLDFIKEIPVQKRPVDLNKITLEVIEQAKCAECGDCISMQAYIPDGLMVPGDEGKLRRVIGNLVNNAADALRQHRPSHPFIHISAWVEHDQLMLAICDNGPGIPQEIMGSLFEPFVTKNKNNGTGLGLAIVKQYVLAHGGRISVSNNQGAVFTIVLPLQ